MYLCRPGCPGTLCRSGWPWTHRDFPASASQMLGLKTGATCIAREQLLRVCFPLLSCGWVQGWKSSRHLAWEQVALPAEHLKGPTHGSLPQRWLWQYGSPWGVSFSIRICIICCRGSHVHILWLNSPFSGRGTQCHVVLCHYDTMPSDQDH